MYGNDRVLVLDAMRWKAEPASERERGHRGHERERRMSDDTHTHASRHASVRCEAEHGHVRLQQKPEVEQFGRGIEGQRAVLTGSSSCSLDRPSLTKAARPAEASEKN